MNQINMVGDKNGQKKKYAVVLLRKRKHNYFLFRTLGEKKILLTKFWK